jgi:hypothetical protein
MDQAAGMGRAAARDHSGDPIAVSIDAAVRLSGIGRTSLYQAMDRGSLAHVKHGKRRLILVADLNDYLMQRRRVGGSDAA